MGKLNITNEEEALAAVKEFGLALESVPKKLRKVEVYLASVKQSCYAPFSLNWS